MNFSFNEFVSGHERRTGLSLFTFLMKPGVFGSEPSSITAIVVASDNCGVTIRKDGTFDVAYIPWANIACVSQEKKES